MIKTVAAFAALLFMLPASAIAQENPGNSIYNIKTMWTTQDGQEVNIASLRGHPVVLAMVYTSCQSACPMIVSDLKRVEENLSESQRAQVRFALFSFDPVRDTPARLKQFAAKKSIDTTRWTLFHGSPSAVRKLAAVLGIRYKMNEDGDFDHSNMITVLDQNGVIKHQQIGLRQDPKETIEALSLIDK